MAQHWPDTPMKRWEWCNRVRFPTASNHLYIYLIYIYILKNQHFVLLFIWLHLFTLLHGLSSFYSFFFSYFKFNFFFSLFYFNQNVCDLWFISELVWLLSQKLFYFLHRQKHFVCVCVCWANLKFIISPLTHNRMLQLLDSNRRSDKKLFVCVSTHKKRTVILLDVFRTLTSGSRHTLNTHESLERCVCL